MNLNKAADRSGFIGTIVVHALLLILIILFGKSCVTIPPDPLDGGVEVRLGDPDEGGPEMNPALSETQPEVQEESAEEESSQVTSDQSDAPAIQETPRAPRTTTPSTTTPSTTTQTPPETPRRPNQRDLFGNNPGSGGSSGSGETPGTQGDPNGSDGEPDGNIGPGIGFSGDGFEGKIDGFKAVGTFKPTNEQQEFGKVVVKVCVDRDGKIVSVQGGQRGSTNSSTYLRELSEKAARKFRFERIGTASEVNCGFITFTYKAG